MIFNSCSSNTHGALPSIQKKSLKQTIWKFGFVILVVKYYLILIHNHICDSKNTHKFLFIHTELYKITDLYATYCFAEFQKGSFP